MKKIDYQVGDTANYTKNIKRTFFRDESSQFPTIDIFQNEIQTFWVVESRFQLYDQVAFQRI